MKIFNKILDWLSPVEGEIDCGCGEWYPDSNCESCHGTGAEPIIVNRDS